MNGVGFVGCFLMACGVVLGCAAGVDDSCTVQSDCVDGYVCYRGKCEKRGHLVVETDSLPNAVVGVEYRVSMEADGGVEPYEWTLQEAPGWLSLDRDSGLLSGVALDCASNVKVVIGVTDSGDGEGQSVSVTLTVVECVDGVAQACFEVQGGKCLQGSAICSGGEWAECSGLVHSSRMDHCGPECGECDAEVGDGCYLGLCTCGDGAACAGGQLCCLQKCVDITQDDANCGQCGLSCFDEVNGASGAHCELGHCEYDTCDDDKLDCDGDRTNGCETSRGKDNCGYCEQSCAMLTRHASGVVCRQDESNLEFSCDYEQCEVGFHDCDGDRTNGCETPADYENCAACGDDCSHGITNRECVLDATTGLYRCGCVNVSDCGSGDNQCCDNACFPRNDPHHCSDCFTSCDDPLQPACVDNSRYYACGCDSDEQCGAGSICCDNHCIAIDEQNCGECGRVCDAKGDHGSRCDTEAGICYCEDNDDCILSEYANSNMSCRSSVCVCEWSNDPLNPVDPTYPDANIPCCGNAWVYDISTNSLACGQCGVRCRTGVCINGGCGCSSDGDCPKYSSATRCNINQGRCFCEYNPDGGFPCQDGRSCCSGTMGGTGGPDGGQDQGCCWYQCGKNEPGDCLY